MVLQDAYCHFQLDLALGSMTNAQVAIVPINLLLFQHQECNKAHALLLFPVTKNGCQRGVPRMLMHGNNYAKAIDKILLPSTTEAVQQYQRQEGQLTDPWQVGKDPLEGNACKYGVRQTAFSEKYPSFQDIFSK